MESEIYKACRNNDINLVRALIETSPPGTDINRLESNGSTALHVACNQGYANIAQLLLYEYNVDPDKKNDDGQTAYEEASTDEIRQLFNRLKKDKYRFCTDKNTANPFEVINDGHPPKSHWIHHYHNDTSILIERYYVVLDQQRNALISIINMFKYFVGIDTYKKKIEQWSTLIQSLVNEGFISTSFQYSHACKLLQTYKETGNIEHLFKLYTLDKSFCQYLGQDQHKTNCFYAPIDFYLSTVENRAYKGHSYRGLTMTIKDFDAYKYAFKYKKSYIRTNTFCSTSIDPAVAKMFADSDNPQDGKVKVLMNFHFVKSCSTAIILFEGLPYFKSISNFDEEHEVLILPGTIFSVKDIKEDNQTQLRTIYLQNYNTDEQEAEMHQERFKSFIDSVFLDEHFLF